MEQNTEVQSIIKGISLETVGRVSPLKSFASNVHSPVTSSATPNSSRTPGDSFTSSNFNRENVNTSMLYNNCSTGSRRCSMRHKISPVVVRKSQQQSPMVHTNGSTPNNISTYKVNMRKITGETRYNSGNLKNESLQSLSAVSSPNNSDVSRNQQSEEMIFLDSENVSSTTSDVDDNELIEFDKFSIGGIRVREENGKRRLSFSANYYSTLGALCTPSGGFTHHRILYLVTICFLIVVVVAIGTCILRVYLIVLNDTQYRFLSIFLAVFVCLSSIILSGIISAFAFSVIRSARVAAVLTAIVASHISRYDLDGADKHLEAMEATTPKLLGREFRSILDNLRMYQRFLPRALVHKKRRKNINRLSESSNTASSIYKSTSIHDKSEFNRSNSDNVNDSVIVDTTNNDKEMLFATHRLRSYKFKQVRGTIMIVRLVDLSTSSPQRATDTVNHFLSECMNTAEDFGGVVDQIEANNLIVTFNYHIPLVKHEDAACKCAVELLQRLSNFSHRILVSICSGGNLVGTVGSETQKSRVVTGETMDLCKKLHSLLTLDSTILATESVVDRTTLAAIPVDVLAPNWFQSGRCKSVVVYEIQGGVRKREAPAEFKRIAEGFQMLRMRKLDEAYEILKDINHAQARRLSHIAQRLQLDSSLGSGGGRNLYQRKELGWEMIEDDDFFSNGNVEELASSRSFILHDQEDDAIDAARKKLMKMHVTGKKKPQMEISNAEEQDSLFSIFCPLNENETKREEANNRSSAQSMMGSVQCSDSVVQFNHTELEDELPVILTDCAGVNYHRSKAVLGKGAFGKVYLAMDDDGTLCALKAFHLSDQNETEYGDPMDAARAKAYTLIHEVEVLAQMRHENIAAYVSCAVEKRYFCIMMEYLAAGSLRTMISPDNYGYIPKKVILSYMRDILNGLQFLHDNNYVHCDIKPDNILLTGDGSCKLADFGTAKLLQLEHTATMGITFKEHYAVNMSRPSFDEAEISPEIPPQIFRAPSDATSNASNAHILTPQEILKIESAMVRGTPRYMAPEAALGEFQPASDIYSIGITILELATGINPWSHIKGDDTTFLMRLATDDSMSPLVPDDLDVDLLKLVQKCISQDPTQRFSAGDLLMTLHE